MKYLRPIKASPNAQLWSQVFALAGRYYQAIKSGSYSNSQLRQSWADYVTSPAFEDWIGSQPSFKAEIQGYGKNTLVSLIGGG
jgi:hypothetical protein